MEDVGKTKTCGIQSVVVCSPDIKTENENSQVEQVQADHNLEDIVSADKDRGNSTEEKHQGISGIIGTVASVWLYYNFCGWLNILNCTLPPVGMILVLAYFMNKEDFETDQPKLKTIDWFAVAGVILGAIVANLLHWGIASINGMVVAAVCYCVGQAVNKRK